MKPAEILRECERAELMAAQYGHMSDAYVVLRVPGIRRGENARIVPGLYGHVLGHNTDPHDTCTMVMVYCTKVRQWLKDRGVE